MRALFGLLSVLVGLAIVVVLLRQQINTTSHIAPPIVVTIASSAGIALSASSTPAQQVQHIEQQFKQALDQAMQARPLPKEAQ